MSERWEKAFGEGKLILRDHLAYHRTSLANQRTLLAYVRTALTFIVAGLAFLHFSQMMTAIIMACVFIPLGIVALVMGIVVYFSSRARIRQTMDEYADIPPGASENTPPGQV